MDICGMWAVYREGVGFLRDEMYPLGQWILILEACCSRISRRHQATFTPLACWSETVSFVWCSTALYTKYIPCQLMLRSLEWHVHGIYQSSHKHLHYIFPAPAPRNKNDLDDTQIQTTFYILQFPKDLWLRTSSFKTDFLGIVCLLSSVSLTPAQYLERWHLR